MIIIDDDGVMHKVVSMDILDKIRAEIEQNAYPIVHGVNNHEKGMTLYGILQVIDKYKVENEKFMVGNYPVDDWNKKVKEPKIPYLMHKEMGIPLSECQKAYDVAIDYLRSQGKLRG